MARFEPARATAALAVAAIIAGWGIAQSPTFLPGLTIDEAAAGRPTLVSLLVSIGLGALVLIPSLALLFGLTLGGRFDPGPAPEPPAPRRELSKKPLAGRGWGGASLACLAVGAVLLFFFDSDWVQVTGSFFLLAFIASGLVTVVTSAGAHGFADERE
jgi:cytochrome d ubiquinol oxidase subunit II